MTNIAELVRHNKYLAEQISDYKFKLASLTNSWKDNKHTIAELEDQLQNYKRHFTLLRDGLAALLSEIPTSEELE